MTFSFMNANSCRNCGSSNFLRVESGGRVEPFFAYRAWGVRGVYINLLRLLPSSLTKLVPKYVRAKCRSSLKLRIDSAICGDCLYYSTYSPVPDILLNNLYLDYRSPSYFLDRDYYEPGFSLKSALMPKEDLYQKRLDRLEKYLMELSSRGTIDIQGINSLLDWGGSDGRVLPHLGSSSERYVYDISEAAPVLGVTKLSELSPELKFDYIQVCHVLEHIPNPLEFLSSIVSHLSDNGLLYVEVPLEVDPDSLFDNVLSGKVFLYVHEHVNKFVPSSLRSLVLAAGLSVADIRQDLISIQGYSSNIIRLVALKSKSPVSGS